MAKCREWAECREVKQRVDFLMDNDGSPGRAESVAKVIAGEYGVAYEAEEIAQIWKVGKRIGGPRLD